MTRSRRWFILMFTAFALSPFYGAVRAQGAPGCFDDVEQGYASYVHNPGNLGDCVANPCVQDLDLDFYEYWDFLDEYWSSGHATPKTAAVDTFECWPEVSGPGVPHGSVVAWSLSLAAFSGLTGATTRSVPISSGDLEGLLQQTTFAAGSAINISASGFTLAQQDAIADEIHTIFDEQQSLVFTVTIRPAYKDKFIAARVLPLGGQPDVILNWKPVDGGVLEPAPANSPVLWIGTHWGGSRLAAPNDVDPYSRATHLDPSIDQYFDGTSFSLPLVTGVASVISSIIRERDGAADPAKLFDYMVSSCDRPDDPAYPFAHRNPNPNYPIPGHAPWSQRWGYGVFSAWKALVYALGYGELASIDSSLDTVDDVETVFSDAFELRGDLFVPAGHSFRVGSLGSIDVCSGPGGPCVPEGPTDLGTDPSLQEVHVAGSMTVEGEVTSSIAVADGGELRVASGGVLTIGEDQAMTIAEGGDITVEDGGVLILLGATEVQGNLTLQTGSTLYLNADLYVAQNARFAAYGGSTVIAADEDAAGGGNDPFEVEILCDGHLVLVGAPGNRVVLRSDNPGVSDWAGITWNSVYDPSMVSAVIWAEISDAKLALSLAGTRSIALFQAIFSNNETGIRIDDRDNDTLSYVEIQGSTRGLELDQSNATLQGSEIHDNGQGIYCLASSPHVRSSSIYGNDVGVVTTDPASVPDLGSVSSPGNNDFAGAGNLNTVHIAAVDPSGDIHAQQNWWGTVKASAIRSRIVVGSQNPPPVFTVVFEPFLTSPPN